MRSTIEGAHERFRMRHALYIAREVGGYRTHLVGDTIMVWQGDAMPGGHINNVRHYRMFRQRRYSLPKLGRWRDLKNKRRTPKRRAA